jgi:hypothetical protein
MIVRLAECIKLKKQQPSIAVTSATRNLIDKLKNPRKSLANLTSDFKKWKLKANVFHLTTKSLQDNKGKPVQGTRSTGFID